MEFSFQPSIELLPNNAGSVAFVPDSSTVFREDTRLDVRTLPNGMKFIPWGVDNMMPYNIITALAAPLAHRFSPLWAKIKRSGLLRFQINNFLQKLLIWEEKPPRLKFGRSPKSVSQACFDEVQCRSVLRCRVAV